MYGDPNRWSIRKTGFLTFLSFIDVNKYPPSLLFLCITIGPSLLVLSLIEKIRNGFTAMMRVYGRVPFFYYVIHIYLVHLMAAIAFFSRGHSFEEATKTGSTFPFYFVAPAEGYSLGIVYLVWAVVVIVLYPLCRWFDRYKSSHKEKWWLSYL